MALNALICSECGSLWLPHGQKGNCNYCNGELLDTGEYWQNFTGIKPDVLDQKNLYLINTVVIPYGKFDKMKYDMAREMEERKSKSNEEEQKTQSQPNIPKCPTCQSTDLAKISSVGKVAKVGFFGIFGAGDLGKTWKCKNCGSKW